MSTLGVHILSTCGCGGAVTAPTSTGGISLWRARRSRRRSNMSMCGRVEAVPRNVAGGTARRTPMPNRKAAPADRRRVRAPATPTRPATRTCRQLEHVGVDFDRGEQLLDLGRLIRELLGHLFTERLEVDVALLFDGLLRRGDPLPLSGRDPACKRAVEVRGAASASISVCSMPIASTHASARFSVSLRGVDGKPYSRTCDGRRATLCTSNSNS
jgi:hypothetical protein